MAAFIPPQCAGGKLQAGSMSAAQKIPRLRQGSRWVRSIWQYRARWNESEWHAEFLMVVMAWMLVTSDVEYWPPSHRFRPSHPPSLSGNLFMELPRIRNLFPWGRLSFRLARHVRKTVEQYKKKSFQFDALSYWRKMNCWRWASNFIAINQWPITACKSIDSDSKLHIWLHGGAERIKVHRVRPADITDPIKQSNRSDNKGWVEALDSLTPGSARCMHVYGKSALHRLSYNLLSSAEEDSLPANISHSFPISGSTMHMKVMQSVHVCFSHVLSLTCVLSGGLGGGNIKMLILLG